MVRWYKMIVWYGSPGESWRVIFLTAHTLHWSIQLSLENWNGRLLRSQVMAFDLDMISIGCVAPMDPVMKFSTRVLDKLMHKAVTNNIPDITVLFGQPAGSEFASFWNHQLNPLSHTVIAESKLVKCMCVCVCVSVCVCVYACVQDSWAFGFAAWEWFPGQIVYKKTQSTGYSRIQ